MENEDDESKDASKPIELEDDEFKSLGVSVPGSCHPTTNLFSFGIFMAASLNFHFAITSPLHRYGPPGYSIGFS